MAGQPRVPNRSIRATVHRPSAPLAWPAATQALAAVQPHLTLPQEPASAFSLLCHQPVAAGQGMIDAMQGGMFFYLYRITDPTSQLASVARVIPGFGFDLLLRQPAARLLVADYTLTGVTEHGRAVTLRYTAADYQSEELLVTVSADLASVSAPSPRLFGVDGIAPNARHQVVGVPPPDTERWVTVSLDLVSSGAVFVSGVTVHVA
jgi:hypothetical protein